VIERPTIHASAVLIGPKAALIRGPAGSGKSSLAWQLLSGALPFARLVADDRAHIDMTGGQVLVRPAPALAGLIEIRGLGIRRLPYEPVAAVGLVIDLAAADAGRLPAREARQTTLEGVALPRLAVAAGQDALHLLLAFLKTTPAAD
jgi:serine kinase of HPr protein (carbohydrate metabolism regulator)